MVNVNFIKQEIDNLYDELINSSATFIYKPNEIKEIKNKIFELQEKCPHEFKNGKCIYCRKAE